MIELQRRYVVAVTCDDETLTNEIELYRDDQCLGFFVRVKDECNEVEDYYMDYEEATTYAEFRSKLGLTNMLRGAYEVLEAIPVGILVREL